LQIHAGGKAPQLREPQRARWWINERDAAPVGKAARRHAGRDPDLSAATAAVHRSAASLGATLTPRDIAIERAGDAAARLDSHIEAMRGSGVLKEFNAAFKRRRMEATMRGKGFMTYANAMTRLRRALIPMLSGGGRPIGPGMFAGILGAT
jgi:hypothetical protein